MEREEGLSRGQAGRVTVVGIIGSVMQSQGASHWELLFWCAVILLATALNDG